MEEIKTKLLYGDLSYKGTVAKCHFGCNLKILAIRPKKFFRLTSVKHQNLFCPTALKFSNFALKAHLATVQ